jgi:hypothetical protein
MKWRVKLAIVCTIIAFSTANAQENRPSTSRPPGSSLTVIAKLRAEAAKLDSARVSELFSVLPQGTIRAQLKLSSEQVTLMDRLERLTRDIIKGWLLRDLDATPVQSSEVLAERLSDTGDRIRKRIAAHAEAMVIEGILTQTQQRICLASAGRKSTPLLRDRFGPPREFIPSETLSADQMAGLVMETVNSYDRAGAIFDAILGQKRLGEFLDPRTNQVPAGLLPYARDFMPAVSPLKVESDLANRLDLLTLDIFRSWLTRDLNNTPPPATAELRQRLIGHRRLENSLFGHAEGIALDGILTPEHAELCLRRIWIDRGMRALQDPALAARLRL